ncbi:HD superfamily phosphohydrolase [Hoeflea marina]|uniref:HD superfamily phosphohydrolase n=1 Tax=Hoeflea marina TaxID=274592 RepID=A0A317PEK0_9HYPH|nr:HD domain-containing protein [Hoeflea marina]PWV97556.1 HD superfamily phosphohydrolase [Hoeflea marina]
MAELPFFENGQKSEQAATELALLEGSTTSPNDEVRGEGELQEFYLPVTGFFQFYPEELAIINHPAFQRLSKINQLGQAHLVYRGATHKRIEHVLGSTAVADKICRSVKENMIRRAVRHPGRNHPPALSLQEIRFIRLSALLHDIGHVAAGHTLEDELNLLDIHDGHPRIDFILDRTDWPGGESISLRKLIDDMYSNFLPPPLKKKGMTPSLLITLIIRKHPKDKDKYEKNYEALASSDHIRFRVCQNIVGNTICADLLDYIYRDWYHIGRVRTVEDRLYQYMEIARGPDSSHALGDSNPSCYDEFVIRLTSSTGRTRTDGVTAILGLLEWRYELAETVLFHRTKAAAASMLGRAFFELWGTDSSEKLLERVIDLSDDQLLDYALDECSPTQNNIDEYYETRSKITAKSILHKLKNRRLQKEFVSYESRKLLDAKKAGLAERFGVHGSKKSSINRYTVARDIELDFELPAGSISIYCTEVKPKIADVNIEVDGEVARFSEYESGKNKMSTKDSLTGGHLSAQIKRFSGLWKIQFFIDLDVKENMDPKDLRRIDRFIKEVVTSVGSPPAHVSERCRSLARDFVDAKAKLGDNNIKFVDNADDEELAARLIADVGPEPRYPNGVLCLRNFFRRDGEK